MQEYLDKEVIITVGNYVSTGSSVPFPVYVDTHLGMFRKSPYAEGHLFRGYDAYDLISDGEIVCRIYGVYHHEKIKDGLLVQGSIDGKWGCWVVTM